VRIESTDAAKDVSLFTNISGRLFKKAVSVGTGKASLLLILQKLSVLFAVVFAFSQSILL
jgi:hypothetical protein